MHFAKCNYDIAFFCEVMVDDMFGGSLTIEDSLPILGKYSI